MANPRIDELRKRLEKEPGSRLFAQLAEELRKEGDLEEAVRLCREGLQKHPNYPSARMTLGRALFDTGDLAGARDELGAVLKGAPDNILASRLLAEALEGLGDLEGARAQYKRTLALAPGDKVAAGRLQAIEGGAPGQPTTPAPRAAPPTPSPAPAPAAQPVPPPPAPRSMPPTKGALPPTGPAPAATVVAAALARAAAAKSLPPKAPSVPPPAPPAPPEQKPIPLVTAEEGFELESAHEAAPVAFAGEEARTLALTPEEIAEAASAGREEPALIALVAAEEEFELERPYEAAPVAFTAAQPSGAEPEKVPASGAVGEGEAPVPLVAAEEEFELERPYEAAPVAFTEESSGITRPLDRASLGLATETAEAARAAVPPPVPAAEEVLDFDEAPTISDASAFREEPLAAPPPVVEPEIEPVVEPEEPRPETMPFVKVAAPEVAAGETQFEAEAVVAAGALEAAVAAPPAGVEVPASEEIASATLAELYYEQGFPERAIEVYRALLARDPGHERARSRIAEIESLAARAGLETPPVAAAAAAGPAGDRTARRAAVERQIARLEAMLAAIRKE